MYEELVICLGTEKSMSSNAMWYLISINSAVCLEKLYNTF
jgi:hypothetical protein